MASFWARMEEEQEYMVPLHPGSDGKEAGLFWLLSQPWLSMQV